MDDKKIYILKDKDSREYDVLGIIYADSKTDVISIIDGVRQIEDWDTEMIFSELRNRGIEYCDVNFAGIDEIYI